jgi:hypothetical protein
VSRFLLAIVLALVPAPALAQQYGPAVVAELRHEMRRGDVLDIEIGKDFSWVEADSEAVAAFMREGNKLRLVAIKPGTATVVLTEDKKLVWKAEVTVR